MIAALAEAVSDRLEAALDGPNAVPAAEDRLRAWLLVVTRALEGRTPAVQWACSARGSQAIRPRCTRVM